MTTRPNIVFILTDDQGAWAIGKETPEIITPNLNRLCDEGVRFTNFFCASPVCSPARCSIVTGRIPSAHGVHDWLNAGNVDRSALTPEMQGMFQSEKEAIDYLQGMPSCFDALHEAGYHMGFVGKWHMGDSMRPRPGFDVWTTLLRGGAHYQHADVCIDGKPQFIDQYVTDFFTDQSVEYIRSQPEAPFFLAVHYTAPHTPWAHEEHRADLLKRYDDCAFQQHPLLPIHPDQVGNMEIGDTEEKRQYLLKGYYAAITAVDEGIGRIMDALRESGQLENTIIIFTSDNGMNLGQHGVWGKGNGTWPMNMYDSSIKVPFIVWGPQWVRQGAVVENLISHYDLLPTLYDFLGIEDADHTYLPGETFLKELTCGRPSIERMLCIMDEYGPVRMVRDKTHKLVWEPIKGGHQFYDLEKDPEEKNNLYNHPDTLLFQHNLLHVLNTAFQEYACLPFDGCELMPTGSGQNGKLTKNFKEVFDRSISLYWPEQDT